MLIKRAITLLLLLTLAASAVTYTHTRELGGLLEEGWLIIEREDILASGALSLAELLSAVPGVIVNTNGAPTGLATLSLRGAASRQVRVNLDGVPLNQATNGVVDLAGIPLSLVERIEINRTTAGILAGSAAVGGTVNIVTLGGDSALSVAVGSAGEERYALGYGLGNPGVRLDAWLESSDGRRANSDGERLGARASIGLETGGLLLDLAYTLRTAELGVPGPRPAPGDSPVFGDDEVTSLLDRQRELEHAVSFNGGLDLDAAELWLRARWSDGELEFDNWYAYGGHYHDQSVYGLRTLYAEVGGTWSPLDWLGLAGGFDYRADALEARIDSTYWDDPDSPDDEGLSTTTEWSPETDNLGGFLKVQGLFDGWGAEADLRLDNHSEYGFHLAPGGLIRLDLEMLQLVASGGLTYAPPTLNDLYWPGSGNPDLEPETGWQADLSAILELGGQRFEAAGFYRVTSELIAWTPDADGWWRPANINEQRVVGVTVETALALGDELRPRLAYTYTDATQRNSELVYSDFVEGDSFEVVERRAANLPEHQVRLTLPLMLSVESGVLVNLLWTGDRVAYYPDYSAYPVIGMNEKTIPAALTLDLRAEYRLDGGLALFCDLRNLTDEDAPAAFGDTYADRNYPRAPRSFTIGAELSL